jgi:hypothetical protein
LGHDYGCQTPFVKNGVDENEKIDQISGRIGAESARFRRRKTANRVIDRLGGLLYFFNLFLKDAYAPKNL